MKHFFLMSVAGLGLLLPSVSPAGQVTIVAADFQPNGGDRWSVRVTLKHADSGWDHYADEWRIVAADGTVLGDRVLYPPPCRRAAVYPWPGQRGDPCRNHAGLGRGP